MILQFFFIIYFNLFKKTFFYFNKIYILKKYGIINYMSKELLLFDADFFKKHPEKVKEMIEKAFEEADKKESGKNSKENKDKAKKRK